MLRRTLIASALVLGPIAAFAVPTVGQAAPDFTLTDTSGRSVRLSD